MAFRVLRLSFINDHYGRYERVKNGVNYESRHEKESLFLASFVCPTWDINYSSPAACEGVEEAGRG